MPMQRQGAALPMLAPAEAFLTLCSAGEMHAANKHLEHFPANTRVASSCSELARQFLDRLLSLTLHQVYI